MQEGFLVLAASCDNATTARPLSFRIRAPFHAEFLVTTIFLRMQPFDPHEQMPAQSNAPKHRHKRDQPSAFKITTTKGGIKYGHMCHKCVQITATS